MHDEHLQKNTDTVAVYWRLNASIENIICLIDALGWSSYTLA